MAGDGGRRTPSASLVEILRSRSRVASVVCQDALRMAFVAGGKPFAACNCRRPGWWSWSMAQRRRGPLPIQTLRWKRLAESLETAICRTGVRKCRICHIILRETSIFEWPARPPVPATRDGEAMATNVSRGPLIKTGASGLSGLAAAAGAAALNGAAARVSGLLAWRQCQDRELDIPSSPSSRLRLRTRMARRARSVHELMVSGR